MIGGYPSIVNTFFEDIFANFPYLVDRFPLQMESRGLFDPDILDGSLLRLLIWIVDDVVGPCAGGNKSGVLPALPLLYSDLDDLSDQGLVLLETDAILQGDESA